MRRWMGMPITASYLAAALMLTACVTINVYFPAAEAKEAAKEFVEKVIGDEVQSATPAPAPSPGGMAARGTPARGMHFDPLMLIGIAPAYAQGQPDITIKTPAIQAIQARMKGRFDSVLRMHFDAGALGFSNDGLVNVRDAAKIALKDRVAVNQAVADQNRDSKAVYREVAVANNHPEWEAQIRGVFAKQWIDSAKAGWSYQDAGGAWKQK
ncbi:MAG: DUF1318 domain-containing protein [Luteimonas sp.]